MNGFSRPLHLGLICALLCSALVAVAGGPIPARAASKQTCTTVKKHGKKVRVCKPAKTPSSLPIHPSDGLPAVTVAPHTDAGHAVTKTIPVDGGEISATGVDGTVYTLTFPKGSLVADQVITMTPLSGVDKIPGGHPLAAGVQLDPEGLQLGQPASLTIKLAKSIPVQNQVSFASGDSGADFHLYPQSYDPQTVTMQISHFTEYGVFPGSAIDVFTEMKYGTLSYLSLAEQFRAVLGEVRQADLMGQPEPYTWQQIDAKFTAVVEAWYEQKVLPGMELAVDPNADDEQAAAAIHEVFTWERQIQLMGTDKEHPDLEVKWNKLLGMVQTAVKNAYIRARDRCIQKHDLSVIQWFGSIEHTIELMGYDFGPLLNFYKDLPACLHFELDVDTTYTARSSGHGASMDTSGHVQVAALPLTLDNNFRFVSGSKQIDYLQFNASGGAGSCSVTPAGTTLGNPFSARLTLVSNPVMTPKGTPAQQPKLTLTVDPGTAQEHVHLTCPGQYDHVFDYSQFTGLWDDAAGIGHTFSDWTILGGATYATYTSGTKTFTYSVGGDTVVFTMSTTMTLRHTPG